MKKCSKCSKKSSVNGLEDAPFTEMASAVVGGYAAGMVDNYLKFNSDGTPKTGMLAESAYTRNALIAAAGIALAAYMKDDVSKGAGIGLVTYAGYQIIYDLMNSQSTGVAGMMMLPPQNINGFNTTTGAYGYTQPSINATTDAIERMRIYENEKAYPMMVNDDDIEYAP